MNKKFENDEIKKELSKSFKKFCESHSCLMLNSMIINRMFGISYNHQKNIESDLPKIFDRKEDSPVYQSSFNISVNIRYPNWINELNDGLISKQDAYDRDAIEKYKFNLNETYSLYAVRMYEEYVRFSKDLYAIIGAIEHSFFDKKERALLNDCDLNNISDYKKAVRSKMKNIKDNDFLKKFKKYFKLQFLDLEFKLVFISQIRHAIVHDNRMVNLEKIKKKIFKSLGLSIKTKQGSNSKFDNLFDEFKKKYLKEVGNSEFIVEFFHLEGNEIKGKTFTTYYAYHKLIESINEYVLCIYTEFCKKYNLTPEKSR